MTDLATQRGNASRLRQSIQSEVTSILTESGHFAAGLHTLGHPEGGSPLHDTTYVSRSHSEQRLRVTVSVTAVDRQGNPI